MTTFCKRHCHLAHCTLFMLIFSTLLVIIHVQYVILWSSYSFDKCLCSFFFAATFLCILVCSFNASMQFLSDFHQSLFVSCYVLSSPHLSACWLKHSLQHANMLTHVWLRSVQLCLYSWAITMATVAVQNPFLTGRNLENIVLMYGRASRLCVNTSRVHRCVRMYRNIEGDFISSCHIAWIPLSDSFSVIGALSATCSSWTTFQDEWRETRVYSKILTQHLNTVDQVQLWRSSNRWEGIRPVSSRDERLSDIQ